MKIISKILLLVIAAFALTSCSLTFGGLVALDNSFSKGKTEIPNEKIIKLDKGNKIILGLNDSTKVSGIYKGFNRFEKDGKEVETISVLNKNDSLKVYNFDRIKHCIYVDEGGSVWRAVAIGGVIDAAIIYIALKNRHQGFTGRIF